MTHEGIAPEEDERMTIPKRVVSTEAWQLAVPSGLAGRAPLIVIPTVHPRGDRRIVRCAQVALDAGYRVHFVWLGEGVAAKDPAIGETILAAPRTRYERLRSVRSVARVATQLHGAAWHIHDFYFLPAAKRWQRRTRRPVIYDVHEYYGPYYSSKLPVPESFKNKISRFLEWYEVRSVKSFGGANTVTEEMAIRFRARNVPVSVSPNYPLLEQFDQVPKPFATRMWNVLHTGTLTASYGMKLLILLAVRASERGLPFKFEAVARFPSQSHSVLFTQLLDQMGSPENLTLVPSRPAHEMPKLIANAGFGLSLLSAGGQSEIAVASKLYEYALLELVLVTSDRFAQRSFAENYGVSVVGHGDAPDQILDLMLALTEDPDSTEEGLHLKGTEAREKFTWEVGSAPGLTALIHRLIRMDGGTK